MPYTVLSVVSTLSRCGPMDGLMNVIRYLDPSKYRAVVATLSAEPSDSVIESLRSLGVPVTQMGLSRIGSLLFGTRGVRRLVSEIKPDLVHSSGLRADVLIAGAGLECPIVSTVHSDLFEDYRFAYGRVFGTLTAMRQYAALRRFDAVNTVSEPLAEIVLRSGITAHGIANGVELGRYYPAPDEKYIRLLRARLGWPADAVVVLHTGVLRNLKNPVEIVTGFRASQLSKRGFLAFAGEGPVREACELAAGTAPNIKFLGKRGDVDDLLRAADLLISASSSEGISNALIEGCATGIQVLATDIPPHRYTQHMFPDQMRLFDLRGWDSVRAALDSVEPETWRQRFVPLPHTLNMISSRRMSRQYQEFYSDILESRHRATSGQESVASCR